MQNKPQTIVFDLDGVLARAGETEALLEACGGDYAEFNAAASHAEPVGVILRMAQTLHFNGYRIAVYTARSADIHTSTRAWLDGHGLDFAHLFMRAPGTDLPADKIKEQILRAERDTGETIALAIDNDDDCLLMYRLCGVPALKVQYL